MKFICNFECQDVKEIGFSNCVNDETGYCYKTTIETGLCPMGHKAVWAPCPSYIGYQGFEKNAK